MISVWTIILIIIAVLYILASIKVVYQYERGVKFTLGKYSGVMQPGLNFVLLIFQSYRKVDIRQSTIDLKPQEVMTSDKVNLRIDGVLFYAIEQPEKVILNVDDIRTQLEGKATSELKEIIGKLTMSDSLSKRDEIAVELMTQLNNAIQDKDGSKDWGVKVRSIQINNIELPRELVRAMAAQAEAKQEQEARVTKAQGELNASKILNQASLFYNDNKAALRLRELQTFKEIGTEHNTLMIVIPETMTHAEWTLPMALSQQAREQQGKEKKGKG